MAQTRRMISLYLMRHGPADAPGEDPPLTDVGERLIEDAARGMARLGLHFDDIFSSPLQRAARTAELVAATAGRADARLGQRWAVLSEAGPGAHLSAIASRLAERRARGRILVVGHQPDMGRMAMEAIGAHQPLPFDRGTLCGVESLSWEELAAGKPGTLRLLVPAAALALIAHV